MKIRPADVHLVLRVLLVAGLWIFWISPLYQIWRQDQRPNYQSSASLWMPGERNPAAAKIFAFELHNVIIHQGMEITTDEYRVSRDLVNSCASHQLFTRFDEVSYLPPLNNGDYGVIMSADNGAMIACFSDGEVMFWP